MSPHLQPQGAPSGDQANSIPVTAVAGSSLKRLSARLLKLGVAVALIGLAARAITNEQGYFGTDAIIANIEAGYIWNGHEDLLHLDTYLSLPGEGLWCVADRAGHIVGR